MHVRARYAWQLREIRLYFPLQTTADRYLCFHIKSDIIRCLFLDYLTFNWWLRPTGVFYRTSLKHVATYMPWRTNLLCITFKITTILLTQLHVRVSTWHECLIHLHDGSLYWSAPPKPTAEWSAMSAVIRIEPLPSQQWSNASCLLSFVLLLLFTPLTFSSTVYISYTKIANRKKDSRTPTKSQTKCPW